MILAGIQAFLSVKSCAVFLYFGRKYGKLLEDEVGLIISEEQNEDTSIDNFDADDDVVVTSNEEAVRVVNLTVFIVGGAVTLMIFGLLIYFFINFYDLPLHTKICHPFEKLMHPNP